MALTDLYSRRSAIEFGMGSTEPPAYTSSAGLPRYQERELDDRAVKISRKSKMVMGFNLIAGIALVLVGVIVVSILAHERPPAPTPIITIMVVVFAIMAGVPLANGVFMGITIWRERGARIEMSRMTSATGRVYGLRSV
jgi:hypothetical protein